jgi:hypothetical protein
MQGVKPAARWRDGLHAAAAALCLALAAVPMQSALAQEDEAYERVHQDARTQDLNETADEQKFRELRRGVFWESTFGHANTRYIRFRFDNIKSPPGAAYRIRILQLPLENEVASYPAGEFAHADTFMTGLLPAGEFRIELLADSTPKGLSFRLASALWQVLPTEALVHSPIVKIVYANSFPATSPLREPAHAVAMLHIGPLETTCTGVLIEAGTIATNYHCMKYSLAFQQSKQSPTPSCDDVMAEFEFLALNQRGTTAKCRSVTADEKLDLAFLGFDPRDIELAPGKPRQPVKIRPASEGMPSNVELIHHPLGLPLVIDEHCAVRKVEQPDLLHDCSAVNGSSGSPLFDEKLRWIGLHYKGPYPRTWTIEKIFDDIQKNGPSYNRARESSVIEARLKK